MAPERRLEMMTVYVQKIDHQIYRYLATWSADGNTYTDGFRTLKDLHEYTAKWNATYHYAWKEA